MTYAVPISERLTHRYVGTYSRMDDWIEYGIAKLLKVRQRERFDHMHHGPILTYTLALPRSMRRTPHKKVRDILVSSFSQHGCAHEYDCCGCASYTVTDVRHAKRREWTVTVATSYNY